jgi:hypothetical protein
LTPDDGDCNARAADLIDPLDLKRSSSHDRALRLPAVIPSLAIVLVPSASPPCEQLTPGAWTSRSRRAVFVSPADIDRPDTSVSWGWQHVRIARLDSTSEARAAGIRHARASVVITEDHSFATPDVRGTHRGASR